MALVEDAISTSFRSFLPSKLLWYARYAPGYLFLLRQLRYISFQKLYMVVLFKLVRESHAVNKVSHGDAIDVSFSFFSPMLVLMLLIVPWSDMW